MALGTSVKAVIEKHSAKVGLGFPAISKMELFVTLYDCDKEPHLRCCRGPWSARGYKFSFCIDHHINFPCLQKKLCHCFFYLLQRFVHQWYIFFSEKLIRTFRSFKFFHQQTSFFRTSFNIIWKNDFLHKSWESGKDWFWPFEPIWKLKTTFCKYWTSIQYWEHEGKTKITRRKNHSYTWSFYWVTTWILLFSGSNETWEFLGIFPCEGGGRGRSSAKSIVCIGVSTPAPSKTPSRFFLPTPLKLVNYPRPPF